MRKIIVSAAFAIFSSAFCMAQDVQPFMQTRKGAVSEYSVTVGEKRKPNMGYAYQVSEVTDVQQLDGGKTRVVTKCTILNKKKKPAKLVGVKGGSYIAFDIEADGSYTVGSLLFGQINESAQSEGFLLKIPATMQVGDKLECGAVTQSFKQMGQRISSKCTYSDFSVVSEEDLTTNAGTFHCYVIKGNSSTEVRNQTMNATDTYWFCKGVGIVRYMSDNESNPKNYNPVYFELNALTLPE